MPLRRNLHICGDPFTKKGRQPFFRYRTGERECTRILRMTRNSAARSLRPLGASFRRRDKTMRSAYAALVCTILLGPPSAWTRTSIEPGSAMCPRALAAASRAKGWLLSAVGVSVAVQWPGIVVNAIGKEL
jgi:hypothetical protein